MTEPVWLDKDIVLELHDYVLAETGGASGLRDDGLLESALARPANRYAYEGVDDVAELAATYAVAIAKNHPFVDGNKRAAFMALGLFLEDNRMILTATNESATETMLGVAIGSINIEQLAAWVRANSAAA